MSNSKKKNGTKTEPKEMTAQLQPEETVQPQSKESAPALEAEDGFALLSKYRGAIMGFAAVWILVFHEWQMLTKNPDGGFYLFNFLESFIKTIGFCGVDIFLMLSGVGLTFAIRKGGLGAFYYRRLKRVFLPFLTIAIIRNALEHWGWKYFIGNITGYRFYTESMYTFLWFVPAIITLYLVFPFYYKLFLKFQNKVMFTLGAIEIWLIITLLVRDRMRGDMFGFTNRIPVFLIGILFGWMTQNRKDIRFTKQVWWHIGLTLALGLYFAYLTNFLGFGLIVPVSNCCIPNCLIAITLPFLLAKLLHWLESRTKNAGKAVKWVLSFIGGFSLEFYCLQEWYAGKVMPGLWEHGWSNFGINVFMLLSVTAISFAASLVFKYFWIAVEMPFRKKKTS